MKKTGLILSLAAGLLASPAAFSQESLPPDDTATVRQKVTAVRQYQTWIDAPSGEYSGITRVGGDVYAVVHDKASGGGLFAFIITFDEEDNVILRNVFELEGNAKGKKGLDNEDIVCVGDNLWVAAESDQSIREYDSSGLPTGRRLRIPDDLKKPQSNRGFESLAFDGELFWTTTESPLPGQTRHILQSFSLRTLAPAGRYLYEADAPFISEDRAAAAQAYVHGISAMTALPDGRLAVLEREVYVPSGSFLAKFLSFTEGRIYIVNPREDKGEVLEKTLLTSFTTGAINLANFEGMCLGPETSDGRTTLLLIADSQNGSGGLTSEYLRVISF